MLVFSILPIILIIKPVQSKLNILAIFPHQGKSNFLAYEPLLKTLSEKGHKVTVVSYHPQENPVPNYNDISLGDKSETNEDSTYVSEPSYLKMIGYSLKLMQTGINNCRILLSNENVQSLWKNEKKFHVILVEQFNSDCALAIAYKLRAPIVGITSNTLMPYHLSRFGIPNHPSYTPFKFLSGGIKPNLLQRFERTVFTFYFNYVVRIISQTVDQYTLSQYFHRLPPLEELSKLTKFMLVNEHFTLFSPSILPTNVKQVGGFHILEAKPLPDDLEIFMNGSKKGVIYINLGASVRNTSIAPEKLDAIIAALSKLRQRVIWRWEENSLPSNITNVYVSKWLPQNDVLAHPKLKAMFCHCGLLGISEAMHHGVPVVCMPIFGDQARNAAAVEESGLGVQIQVNELNNDTLLEKFNTVLDKKFRKKGKLLSKMWRDRPKPAREEAIYWIKYAARYPNATFRNPAVDVPMYQYLYIDVLLIFGLILGCTAYLLRWMYKMYRMKYTKQERKSKWRPKKLL